MYIKWNIYVYIYTHTQTNIIQWQTNTLLTGVMMHAVPQTATGTSCIVLYSAVCVGFRQKKARFEALFMYFYVILAHHDRKFSPNCHICLHYIYLVTCASCFRSINPSDTYHLIVFIEISSCRMNDWFSFSWWNFAFMGFRRYTTLSPVFHILYHFMF